MTVLPQSINAQYKDKKIRPFLNKGSQSCYSLLAVTVTDSN